MASDRNTLALAVYLDLLMDAGAWAEAGAEAAAHIRDVLGWRPPAREIQTAAELEALPAGALVLRDGRAWQREHDVWWLGGVVAPATGPFGASAITVLYDPIEETRDE